MKSVGKIVLILLLNIFVSVCATLATLYWWENIRQEQLPFSINQLLNIQPTALANTAPTSAINPPDNKDLETALGSSVDIAPDKPTDLPPSATPSHSPDNTEFVPVTRDKLVSIESVYGIGDLNSETVRIRSNVDEVVTLEGWTIEDAEKHVYTIPNIQLIRKGVFIEVYTRSGHTTPYELYWNQPEARWQSGETVVLKDRTGQIQSTYRIP